MALRRMERSGGVVEWELSSCDDESNPNGVDGERENWCVSGE